MSEWEELSSAFPGAEIIEGAAWRYSTYKPPPTRMSIGELPDHRLGWIKRKTDISGYISYQGRCTCGDKQQGWHKMRGIKLWHEKHLALAQRQYRFL